MRLLGHAERALPGPVGHHPVGAPQARGHHVAPPEAVCRQAGDRLGHALQARLYEPGAVVGAAHDSPEQAPRPLAAHGTHARLLGVEFY